MKAVLRLCAGAVGGGAGAAASFYVFNAALFALGIVSVLGVSPSVLLDPVTWTIGGMIGALTCSIASRRLATSVGAGVAVGVYLVGNFRTLCTVPVRLFWTEALSVLCDGVLLGALSALVAQAASSAFLRWVETGSVLSRRST